MSCTCRLETLNAKIKADEKVEKTIGDIIVLLWETRPDRDLPSRRELIRLIRKKTGFDLYFCPACRRWLPKVLMTRQQGKCNRYDKPRRCKVCARQICRQVDGRRRQRRREMKKAGAQAPA